MGGICCHPTMAALATPGCRICHPCRLRQQCVEVRPKAGFPFDQARSAKSSNGALHGPMVQACFLSNLRDLWKGAALFVRMAGQGDVNLREGAQLADVSGRHRDRRKTFRHRISPTAKFSKLVRSALKAVVTVWGAAPWRFLA